MKPCLCYVESDSKRIKYCRMHESAPVLLDALKGMLNSYAPNRDESKPDELHSSVRDALKALRQAETGHPSPTMAEEIEQLKTQKAELLDTLYGCLPYVEMAESDPAYKPGAIAKVVKQIRSTISLAEGGGE